MPRWWSEHVTFLNTFQQFGRSHFVLGMELLSVLVVLCILDRTGSVPQPRRPSALAAAAVSQLTSRCGSVFIAANWPAWMFAITCLWAPFLYNFEGACHSALALRCFF